MILNPHAVPGTKRRCRLGLRDGGSCAPSAGRSSYSDDERLAADECKPLQLPAIVQAHAAAGTAPRHLRRPSRLPIALAAAVIARRESGPGRAVLGSWRAIPPTR